MKDYDDNYIDETENLLYQLANEVVTIIEENRMLRREVKELREQHDRDWETIKSAYEGSQKVAGAWISALLNHDIQINPKKVEETEQ